jgi:Alginate export
MHRAALFVLALTIPAASLAGQATPAAPPPEAAVTVWNARNWTRAEVWSFFEPPPGGGDNDYLYAANRFQGGLRRTARRYEVTAAFQYVQFGGLPTGAVGPGPLGVGAVYFAHAGRSESRQVYLRYLNLRFKDAAPGLTIQAGRMAYASGSETVSGDTKIEAVKRQRVDARLIGEFEWSLYQRAYDGVRADLARPSWSLTAVAVQPTQGGFEDAAGLMMKDVAVLGSSVGLRPGVVIPHVELQGFAFRYLDHRRVTARADNTGRTADAVDVAVNSFGATVVGASPNRNGGQWDAMLWLVGQSGSWYGQPHRGFSLAAEVGYQWTEASWRPWLRGGFLQASGDDDPADDRHETFFQMLPTVRRYAQTAGYSQMNNTDVFAQALLRPSPTLSLRVDVRRVGLASARDMWYFGSGATQSRGSLFGFSTRPANGATHLASIAEGSADYTVSRRWSVNGYVGLAKGGQVIRRAFTGSTMVFAYLENVLQF